MRVVRAHQRSEPGRKHGLEGRRSRQGPSISGADPDGGRRTLSFSAHAGAVYFASSSVSGIARAARAQAPAVWGGRRGREQLDGGAGGQLVEAAPGRKGGAGEGAPGGVGGTSPEARCEV